MFNLEIQSKKTTKRIRKKERQINAYKQKKNHKQMYLMSAVAKQQQNKKKTKNNI